jgi:16S rRNA (guanine(966)-N(2))-methyltransferase RsmD
LDASTIRRRESKGLTPKKWNLQQEFMRVIAGQYRRRLLKSLPGLEIRPTSDRLRETLFNILCAGNPDALTGSTWLDLYAGTGAVGIEALSRGAGMARFVESSNAASEVIAANLKSLGTVTGFQIMKMDVSKALRQLETSTGSADFVYLDPPYSEHDEYAKTLTALGGSSVLSDSSVVIAEHQKRYDPGEAFSALRRYRTLTQGDAALSFYQRG